MNPLDSYPPELIAAFREWLEGFLSGFLPAGVADVTTSITSWLIVAIVIFAIVQVSMLYATWVERKFIGRMQDRLGANRAGIFGLLQPIADMIKMLTKEDITPAQAHKWVYNLAPILVVPPALIGFSVIPVGIGLVATDLSVGLLFLVAVGSTAVIPLFMAGWGSRNKYALLGAIRAVAQIVSYEIPQIISLVTIVLLASTLSTQGIVAAQGPIDVPGYGSFPGVWFVFLQPVAFLVFILATAAEIERSPFDLPEAESELIAGYHVEYAGIKFGMFYLSIYFMTLISCALGTILFLGGWQPPIAQLSFIPGIVWFVLKSLGLLLLFMWMRATLPRLRMDQVMGFCWKILVPLSLANLVLAAVVSKLTYQANASPPVVFFGFAVANVVLIGLTIWLIVSWRKRSDAAALTFDNATVTESGA